MLHRYFQSVYSDFSSKIETMSQIIKHHPGEHGRLNEVIISQLLREHLPDKYSFGTGFVIDSEGARSRQCDIVVYDRTLGPKMFDRTGPLLFPVESVYAVIEVKTTLVESQIHDACEHIASVRRLVNNAEPTRLLEKKNDGYVLVEYPPRPPLGIIIGYQSTFTRLDKLKQHFATAFTACGEPSLEPDLAISVKDAFVMRHNDVEHSHVSREALYFPLRLRNARGEFIVDASGEFQPVVPEITSGRPNELYVGTLNGYPYNQSYKICSSADGYRLADAATLLLASLGTLDKMLSMKHISRPPFELYLPRHFSTGFMI